MNEDKITEQWEQLGGKTKAVCGKLTDDDLQVAEGRSECLAGKVQERYRIPRDTEGLSDEHDAGNSAVLCDAE